jgi:small subunit ribosomal protein S9
VGDPEKDNTTPETPESPQPEAAEPAPEETAAVEPAATPEEAPASAEAPPAEETPGVEPPVAAEGEVPFPTAPTAGDVPAEEEHPAPQPDEHGRFYGTGRRKKSVARVYLRPGSGQIRVNGRALEEAFTSPAWREHARGALVFADVADEYDAQVSVKGGGSSGQAGAIRQGLARALVLANPALRPKLRQKGFLTRDPRMKERKKYGQKGARKRFQWTKR